MNANYVRGRRAEYKAVDSLKKIGFACIRAASSHGFADVVAVRGDAIIFVQSKTGAKPSPSEYAGIVAQEAPPGTVKIALWYPAGSRFAHVLYKNLPVLPEWCAVIRWLDGAPPTQRKIRGL